MSGARYVVVPASAVPARTRRAAEAAVSFAAVDLELTPPPTIVWYDDLPPTAAEMSAAMGTSLPTPAPPPDSFEMDQRIRGRVLDTQAVWLHAWAGASRTAQTALHETVHVFQHRLQGPARNRAEYQGREVQATDYADGLAEVAEVIANTMRGAPDHA